MEKCGAYSLDTGEVGTMPNLSAEFWVGLVVAIVFFLLAVGVGLGMDTKTKGEYWFVIGCFLASALIFVSMVGVWNVNTEAPVSIRAVCSIIALAIILFGLFEAVRWVQGRHERAIAGGSGADTQSQGSASSSKNASGPVELKFKHTALFIEQKVGSVFVQGKTVKLRAVYENTSDSPAKQISANGVLRFITSDETMKDREEEEWKKFRIAWLASLQGTLKEELDGHKEKSFDVETDPLSPEDAQDLRSVRKYVYFMGAIKWTDDAGEHETDICTYFSPNERGPSAEQPARWRSCLSGHSAVRHAFQITDFVPAFTQRANVQVLEMGFPATPPATDPKWKTGEPILLRVRAINNGPIPAKRMAASFRLAISSNPTERVEQDRIWNAVKTQLDSMPYGDNSLLPGRDALFDIQYPLVIYQELAVTKNDIRQIKTGTKHLIVAGSFKYIDDYGPRETHFCQSYSGTSWRYWTDCYGHNELIP